MMPKVNSVRRVVLWSLVAAGVGVLGACAQAPKNSAAAAATAAYSGRYVSMCATMTDDGLRTVDVLTLKPVDGHTVSAGMSKVFFFGDDCVDDTIIGVLTIPTATWQFDGSAKVGERTVDRVTVQLPEGPIKVSGQGKTKIAASIEQANKFITIHYGKDQKLALSELAAASADKDLRWLDKDHLYMGDASQQCGTIS